MAAAPLTADETFMAEALALGRLGLGTTWPNPSVGCVVVREGRVVGRGRTRPGGRPHAETEALAEAGPLAAGATAYVTLEPCSHYGRTGPCADALARAGIARVVGAVRDPDPRVAGRGFAMLANYGLSVTQGIGEGRALRDHVGHITRVTLGRPHVLLKLALSADGRVAGAGGRPVRITGADADVAVQLIRAETDAIAVGIGTVFADNPRLSVRAPGFADRLPVRVVFDRRLRLATALPTAGERPGLHLIETARRQPVVVLAGTAAPVEAEVRLSAFGIEVMRADTAADHLRLLGARGLTRLMVEGGPMLAASLIVADLVDEARLFRAPSALGEGPLAFSDDVRARLAENLPRLETGAVGRDILTIHTRA